MEWKYEIVQSTAHGPLTTGVVIAKRVTGEWNLSLCAVLTEKVGEVVGELMAENGMALGSAMAKQLCPDQEGRYTYLTPKSWEGVYGKAQTASKAGGNGASQCEDKGAAGDNAAGAGPVL